MKPGPSALQVRFIHESEAHHLREAERWEELYATALARQLAAEAELLIDQRGVLLATGALLAIESMRRSPSVEGDRALRKALCLLPRPHAEVDYRDWSQLAATAFKPGAAHIAGIEKRGVLRVWSGTTGAELARFETEGARDLLMQPTHRRVVTVGDGVVVWSWPEGRALARFPDARGGAYSADGQFFATVSAERATVLWDAETYEQVAAYQNSQPMQWVAVAAGAAELVAWNSDIAEVMRSPGPPAQTFKLQGPNRFVYSPSGDHLFHVSPMQYSVILFDVAARKQLVFEERHWHAAFSADGEHFALASPEWDAHSYDLPSSRKAGHYWIPSETQPGMMERRYVDGQVSCRRGESVHHDDSVNTVAHSLSGRYLGTTSRDGTARAWETYRGREVARIVETADDPIHELAFLYNERLVAARGARTCRTWEVTGHRQVAALAHDDAVLDLSFDSDGSHAATISKDQTARLYALPAGDEVARIEVGCRTAERTIDLAPDAGRAIVDRRAVWDIAAGSLTPIAAEGDSTRWVALSGDIQTAARVAEDGGVVLHDVASGRQLARSSSPTPPRSIVLNWDGSVAALLMEAGGVRLFIRSERGTREIATERAIREAVFSRKGAYLGLLDRDDENAAEVWNLVTRERVRLFQQETKITAIAFDPTERHVALSSKDRAVGIWSLESGVQSARFEHDADVVTAQFSPDGRHVLSAGGRSDRTARLWLWRPDDLIAEACARVGRDLTQEEWTQYLPAEEYRATSEIERKGP